MQSIVFIIALMINLGKSGTIIGMQTVRRLTPLFVPSHYSITLEIDAASKQFTGVVAIDGELPQDSKEIRLHAADLVIHAASINGEDAVTTADGDELVLHRNESFPAGSTRLELSFSGQITETMHGIYSSSFVHDDATHTLIATQFESHHAREAFPCIDEPEAKATFDLTIVTAPGITVLGNMPVREHQEQDGRLITTFETSPRMSTYLLAFVAGKLHGLHGETKNGTKVGVWATPAQSAESLSFALDSAIKATEFFNEYFDTPYPLPKCDHVALPDFSAGAMENWGLITYREVTLLVDPKTSSIAAKEWVATVIAHELSHQWFGNLVTMKWWDDLWLNESFATLMEYVAVDAIYPEWDIWTKFTTHEALAALRRDSLPGVQAVKTDVNHPDEISTLFDGAIVYAKGARLLNMLYRHIGEDAFRQGLKQYFATHSYGNTIGADLWEALEKASGKPVASLMTSWLERPGYPIIYAAQHAMRLNVRQERFLLFGRQDSDSNPWSVPLLASSPVLSTVLFSQTAEAYTLDDETPVLLNASANGHYTVRYETSQQQAAVRSAIAACEVTPSERMLLLNDSILQARAGIGSAVETLQLLEAYSQETSEPVWDMIALAIADIRRLIEDDDLAEVRLKQLVASLVRPRLDRLGWDTIPGEAPSDTKLRATIIGLGIYSEDLDITHEALQRFRAAGSLQELPAELRPVLFAAAIRHDVEGSFDSLMELHRATSNAELQQDIATGLSSTKDMVKAHLLLQQLKDGTVRLQDVSQWIIHLLRNKHTREAAWQWILEEWPWIESNFGNDKSYDNYPRYAASIFATQEWLERYRTFFEPMIDEPALSRVIEVGIVDIASRAAWRDRDAPLLVNHLSTVTKAR